ncbi:MAG TPA: hypothetical protein VGM53_23485 [Streptosporangiaceae bacterium]|jgi:predicted  nucleic acid-binding Zn-ribbon protein
MATTTTHKPHSLPKAFEALDEANRCVGDASSDLDTAQQTADSLVQLQQQAQFENKNAAARFDVLVAKRGELASADIADLQAELTRLDNEYSVINSEIQQVVADAPKAKAADATLAGFSTAMQEWMTQASAAVSAIGDCVTMMTAAQTGKPTPAQLKTAGGRLASAHASLTGQMDAVSTSGDQVQAAVAGISLTSSVEQRQAELVARRKKNEHDRASLRAALAESQVTALDPTLVQYFTEEHTAAKRLAAEAPRAVQQAQGVVAEKAEALALAQQQQQQAQDHFDTVEAEFIEAIDVGKPNVTGWATATVHLTQKIPSPYKLSWDAGGADVKQVPQKDETGLTETVLIDTNMLPVGDTPITVSIER